MIWEQEKQAADWKRAEVEDAVQGLDHTDFLSHTAKPAENNPSDGIILIKVKFYARTLAVQRSYKAGTMYFSFEDLFRHSCV